MLNKIYTSILASLIAVAFANNIKAQELEDTIPSAIAKIQSDLELLKRIKISGYIQPQFQWADSVGIASYAGGNFGSSTDKRFMLRRGRIKIAYETLYTQFVFQIDATEKGIAIKDLYGKFTEPWLGAFSITAGIMNRPFGYEIGYSSSLRESPERGRMSQIIFPGERDLGAMLTFQMPKTSRFNFLKIDAGLYNGTGSTAVDFDKQKDFISHIAINKSTVSEKISYGLGLSYYNGGWRQGRKNVYTMGLDTLNQTTFQLNSDTVNYGQIAKRQYYGADAQLNFDFPFGVTTLRAEYIQGQQPSSSSSTTSASTQPSGDTYLRNFNGAYFYFLQNIFRTKHQIIVKYDWYDPNTKVKGDEIGVSGTKLSAGDIKYTTLGLGWVYHWDSNVKITAYYDMVSNETSKNLSGYVTDIKDNVFTLRVQYKF